MGEKDRPDDTAAVRRLQQGCDSAAAELYRRYVATVRFVVADNVRDRDEIDDVVQEVFGRAFGRIDDLRDAGRFRPWLMQIARRAAIDARRTRLRRPEFASIEDRVVVDDGPAPDVLVEVRTLAAALSEGVDGLSPRDRLVLTMVVELGFGLDEVAEALEISYGNAKVVLHRARRRLREAVAPELVAAG